MTSELRPFTLIEVKDVPTDNALSKLLMKDWFGDDDSSTMEEIMRNWVRYMCSCSSTDLITIGGDNVSGSWIAVGRALFL